jgi:hypothetical protein
MNQEKSNESFNLLNNGSTQFLYNTGTFNISQYMEQDLTQLEGNDPINHPKPVEKHPAKDNPTARNEESTANSISTVGNDETLHDTASAHGKPPTTPTNDATVNGTNNIMGFIRANGTAIVRTPRPTFRPPYNDSSKMVTPQQTKQLMSTATSSRTNDSTAAASIHDLHDPYCLFLNTPKIHHSALLDDKFKPNPAEIELTPELESLRPLIASQHKVFTLSIKQLGNICISLTQLIEKKADSLYQLKNNNKIPRSLRIKCGLTTSPAFMDNEVFLRLKEKLKNEVDLFIQKGTQVMAEWASTNIQLLKIDRCFNLLNKALPILDGLTSYNTEIIGLPSWPSVPTKYTALFLLKLYFSNTIIDVSDIISFLDLPFEQIVIIGSKITLKTNSDEEARTFVDDLLLSDIDMNDELHNIIIRETLLNFDQIMRFTTIYLWMHIKTNEKHTSAALNLESKIMAIETTRASELTAAAIVKATDKIDYDHSLNLNSSLRLNNLERSVRRNEQKTNELLNINKRNNFQKNLHGGYHLEQIASPARPAPSRTKSMVVDLTLDKSEQDNKHGCHRTKKQRKSQHTTRSSKKTKTIQWKDSEYQQFNPNFPAASTLHPQSFHMNHSMNCQDTGTLQPFQQGAPQTFTFGTPMGTPFQNSLHVQNQGHQRFLHQPFHFTQGHMQNQNSNHIMQPQTQNPFNTYSQTNPFIPRLQHRK